MKVLLKGGLGNQLFQYAFAHTDGGKIHFVLDTNSPPQRPFMLSGLLKTCQHLEKITRMSFLIRVKLRVRRLIVAYNLEWLMPLIIRILKLEVEADHNYFKQKYRIVGASKILYIGYFQNCGYVQDSIIHFKSELTQYLSHIFIDKNNFDFKSTIIIHVRRGDYSSPAVINRFGVLSASYYQRSIDEIKTQNPSCNFKYVFLSEKKEDAQKIAAQLRINSAKFYGQEDLDAWQTLKIMSSAHYLIGANSTLSWWGAYLSSIDQGKCVLPSPWFKNWFQQIENDFYPTTTMTVRSDFD